MSRPTTHNILIHSAKQVVKICEKGETCLKGYGQSNIIVINEKLDANGDKIGISIVINMQGIIEAVDYDDEIASKFRFAIFDDCINARGMVLVPGLIDAHTHPIWSCDRVDEFAMKQRGATYNEIMEAGGGIEKTVDETNMTTDNELMTLLKDRLFHMMKSGTTVVECKSGYGLILENEMRLLQLLKQVSDSIPLDLSITYLGAHAVPKGFTADNFADKIVTADLPFIKEACRNHDIRVDNVDVFCDTGYFNPQNTLKILQRAKGFGWNLNYHADELSHVGACELVEKLGRCSVSHVENVSNEGIDALANSESVVVLLPTTQYLLKLQAPPVRKMIQHNIPLALGSDFNPNMYCLSMPIAMHMAVVLLGMSMEEALVAATLNAAASLHMSDMYGSLENGKYGDVLVLDCMRWEHLIYQFGNHDHLIKYVIKKGKIIYERDALNGNITENASPLTAEMAFRSLTTPSSQQPIAMVDCFTTRSSKISF